MPTKKRRVVPHIMEDKSVSMIRQALPEEWVIHDYKPDYGIDSVVEIFDYLDNDCGTAETLGELFFVQGKSVDTAVTRRLTVCGRSNVELGPLQRDSAETAEIDVVHFHNLEVPLLNTVQAMGDEYSETVCNKGLCS